MKFKKFLFGAFCLTATACGYSPEQVDDYIDSEESVDCGWQPPTLESVVSDPTTEFVWDEGVEADVEEAFNHPAGFGITTERGCSMNDTEWPGDFCWAPAVKNWKVRVFDDQDGTWVSKANNEFGQWRDRLNARGWSITKVS